MNLFLFPSTRVLLRLFRCDQNKMAVRSVRVCRAVCFSEGKRCLYGFSIPVWRPVMQWMQWVGCQRWWERIWFKTRLVSVLSSCFLRHETLLYIVYLHCTQMYTVWMGIGEENAPFFSATGWYFIQGWGGGDSSILNTQGPVVRSRI